MAPFKRGRLHVIVSKKLQKEIDAHKIAGPFVSPPFDNLQISPIGIVPKKEPGQFRLIHHYLFLKKKSINDHIPDPFLRFSMLPLTMQLRLLSHLENVAS